MIEICRDHSSNVKRWRDGQMVLRWCAAGMVEAAKQFRRVNGYLHLVALRVALVALRVALVALRVALVALRVALVALRVALVALRVALDARFADVTLACDTYEEAAA
jgi:hypothetical protein